MKADQLDQEWLNLKDKLLNARFISELEKVLDFRDTRVFQHGKVQYNEWDVPQKYISELTDTSFKNSDIFYFTGILQWKIKDKRMISKRIILFSKFHNTATYYDVIQD